MLVDMKMWRLVLIAFVIVVDLLTSIAAADNWKSLGCYTDNVSGRALTGESVLGGAQL